METCANTAALNRYMHEQDEDEKAMKAYEAEKASHAKYLLRRLPDLSDALTTYFEDKQEFTDVSNILSSLFLNQPSGDIQKALEKVCKAAAEYSAECNVKFRSWSEIKAEHAAERADWLRDETR